MIEQPAILYFPTQDGIPESFRNNRQHRAGYIQPIHNGDEK